jgi:hypothetical protein
LTHYSSSAPFSILILHPPLFSLYALLAAPQGGEEDGDGPTLFIDSGNNKDSPAKQLGKPVVIAAGSSGDESLIGNASDIALMGGQVHQSTTFSRWALGGDT